MLYSYKLNFCNIWILFDCPVNMKLVVLVYPVCVCVHLALVYAYLAKDRVCGLVYAYLAKDRVCGLLMPSI